MGAMLVKDESASQGESDRQRHLLKAIRQPQRRAEVAGRCGFTGKSSGCRVPVGAIMEISPWLSILANARMTIL